MGYNPPLIFGPIPAESNPPINPQYYEPSRFEISAIFQGITTLIVTNVNNNYVVGQLVRLVIPQINGSRQLNEQQAIVLAIPLPNEVVLNIDSRFVDPFVPSTPSNQSVPQIMAIGDVNSGQINQGRSNNQTNIPGSFINISPI